MLKILTLLLFFIFSFLTLQAAPAENPAHGLEILAQRDEAGSGKFMEEMLNMFIVLAGIVGVMVLVSWVLKKVLNTKMLQINQTSGIKVIERRTISPKVQIYLLEIRGKGFVIAESPQGVHGLGEFSITSEDDDELESIAEKKEDEIASLTPHENESRP